jgi:hypothetical protein
MHIATHLIKVTGEFDPALWNPETLRSYVTEKLKEMDYIDQYGLKQSSTFHPDIELFDATPENTIRVWLFITGLPSEVSQKIVDKWALDHITEKGLTVKKIEIEIINDLTKPRNTFAVIS